jgi:hypothetical protein
MIDDVDGLCNEVMHGWRLGIVVALGFGSCFGDISRDTMRLFCFYFNCTA